MNAEIPLLSICVPTYNRAKYLREALENITSDSDFDSRVEIVISDNASTDDTPIVGNEYSKKYPNIKNVRDANFKLVLRRASGKYLKLSNDTLRYRPGTIGKILSEIGNSTSEYPIFFYNRTPFCKVGKYEVDSVAQFLSNISYFIGWIGGFGIWRSDLDCLNVPAKYTELQFSQVAWTLEVLKKHGGSKMYFDDLFVSIQPPRKGDYNLFKVQISNLFKVLSDYGLSGIAYEREKYRMFRYQILQMIRDFLILKKETGFDLEKSWGTILREYWCRPYIYPLIFGSWLTTIRN